MHAGNAQIGMLEGIYDLLQFPGRIVVEFVQRCYALRMQSGCHRRINSHSQIDSHFNPIWTVMLMLPIQATATARVIASVF